MEGRTLLRDQAAPSASAPTGRSASQATGDEAAAKVELSKRSCVSCNSKDLQAMSEDSAKTLLEQVAGWEMKNEGGILKLHRAWKVKNFAKGLEFFQLVAAVAEEEGLLSFALFFIFTLSRCSEFSFLNSPVLTALEFKNIIGTYRPQQVDVLLTTPYVSKHKTLFDTKGVSKNVLYFDTDGVLSKRSYSLPVLQS
uniref:4a-hydroxytetrahydrobiopterin dehydratase n=1 Tax=Triticum urartu TaxID=4572 RepID=A0A8R7UXF2_TRIUA